MKKLLFIMMLLLATVPWMANAQQTITIGTGTGTTYYTPFNSLWGYSFVEAIYTGAEIAAAGGSPGLITSISWNKSSGTGQTNNVVVYMKNVNRTSFSSNADWETVTAADIVYSGPFTIPTTGTATITLDVPFVYDGSNLMVAMHEYTSGYTTQYFTSSSTTSATVVSAHSDSSDPNPYNIGAYTGTKYTQTTRANIQIELSTAGLNCQGVGTIQVSDITSTNATLTWGASVDPGTHILQYKTDAQTWDDPAVVTDYPSDTTYDFSNMLTPMTTYNVRVANMCSGGDTSFWRNTTFTTACSDLTTIPHVENFDTYGTGTSAYPTCWTRINTYSSGVRPYVNSTHYAGSGSLYFYSTSGTYNIGIMPALDPTISINDLQASFVYRATNSTDKLIVGVMSDITDASTFVPVDTVYPASPVTAWTERIVSFANYTGTGTNIAFYNGSATATVYAYIDNLVIENIPTCVKPMAVTVSNVGATSADVDWTVNGTEGSWDVVVVPHGDDPSTGIPENTSSHPYTLSNLLDETQYDVYVRANCGSEVSGWTMIPAVFTTDPFCTSPLNVHVSQVAAISAMVNWNAALYGATSYTVGYSESGQDNWITFPGVTGNNYMISGLTPGEEYDVFVLSECDMGDADTVFSSFQTHSCFVGGDLAIGDGTSSTEYFPEYAYYEYSYTQQIFLASEMGGAANISSITFDVTSVGDPTRNIQIYLMHTNSASGSSWLSASNAQQVYSGNVTFSVGLNTIDFTTPFSYNGVDNLVLVVMDITGTWTDANEFKCHYTSSDLSRYVYQDGTSYSITSVPTDGYSTNERNNVIFGVPCDSTASCSAPNSYIADYDAGSVTVAWAPGNMETSWEMEYCEEGSVTWMSEGSVTSPHTVTGLTSDTKYIFRIRANCGGGEYSEWNLSSVRTACSAVTIPYTEDFDDAPASGSGNMVTCWTRNTNYTSTLYPYTSNSQHYSGNYSAYFYGTSAYYSYLASPEFDASVDMTNLQVRFWARKTTASYYIQVGVMTDPNDYSTFVQVGQNLTPENINNWEMLSVNTDQYTGTGRYIAFRIPAASNSYMYIDDINIDVIPLCEHVTSITVSNITTNSVDLSWTPGGNESQWEVVYGIAGTVSDPETMSSVTVSGTANVTLNGLSASSDFDVYVKAVCSGTESSIWMHTTFSTLCGAITMLPYTEDFDDMGSGSSVFPNCWLRYNTYSTTNPYPYIRDTYHASGNASLYFYNSSSTYSMAVLPSVDTTVYPINTLQVRFKIRSTSSTTSGIQVGVMTDSSNVNSFQIVQTIHNTTTGTFQEFEVPLTSYTGNGRFIALKLVNTSSTYSVYMDDLWVELVPLCDKPTNVAASNLTATTADINWMPGGNETDWEVVVVPAGASVITGTPEPVSTHPYTLTNLNDNTSYDVYVRADCGTGTDFSSWSQVCHFATTPLCSAPINVTISQIAGTSALVTWTPALFGAYAYTLAYTETGQQNWTTQTVTGDSYMLTDLTPETPYTLTITSECNEGTAPVVTKTFSTSCLYGGGLLIGNGTSTTEYLPNNAFYEYSYTQQIFLSSEMGGANTINSVAFEASSLADPTRNLQIYLMHTTSSTSVSWLSATNAQQVYSGNVNFITGWTTINFTTPFQYNGTDNLALIVLDVTGDYIDPNYFKCHTTSQELSMYDYQDGTSYSINSIPSYGESSYDRNNVIFGLPCDNTVTCIAPNVYVSEATLNSLTLTWAPGYAESSWEVEISTDNTTWTPQGTVTSSPYTITNLTPSTFYYVRMRSDCGGEYSDWTTVSHYTECAAISSLPFVENFDSQTGSSSTYVSINNLPYCWSNYNVGTSTDYSGYPIIYHSSSTAASPSNSMRFYTYTTSGTYADQTAILPEIDVNTLPMNTLQLSFDARALSASYPFNLRIGVMTDPTDINTFTLVSTVTTQSTSYATYDIPLSQYTGSGAYIAIMAPKPTINYNYGYVDNVKVDYMPDCPMPTSLHAVNATTTSIDLGWTENGSATMWEIEYGPLGFTQGSGTTETAMTNPYTISSLNASTNYEFYVRAVCGAGDSSNYSLGAVAATECEAISQLPYTENFDAASATTSTSAAVNNLPLCWRYLNQGTSTSYSGYPIVYSSSASAASPTNSMRFYSYTTSGTYDDQIAILPEIDVNTLPMNTLQLSFDARNNSSYTFRLIVGVMTNPADKTTFVPVDTIVTTSNTYATYDIPLNQYTGTGHYIALKAPRPTSSYNAGYVDNIVLDYMPSCPKPKHFAVTDVAGTSVTLTWTPMGSETSWEVAYGATGFDPDGTAANVVTANAYPFEVQNLSVATSYDFYVRAACSTSEQSLWTAPVSAATLCVGTVAIPYTENFDSYTTSSTYSDNNGIAPNCWTTYSTNTTYGPPHITSSGSYHYVHSGSNCMVFTCGSAGSDAYAALPEFDQPLNTLKINFWRAMESTTNGSTLTVGYVTNLNNIASSFVTVATIPSVSDSNGDTISVDFTGATVPATGYICFHWNYSSSYYSCCIDDINVTLSGGNAPATCNVPTGLAVNNPGQTTATATWTAGGTETSWNVQYKAATASTWQSATANTTSYTMTGLTPGTAYQ
ncbi:MAG: fibronectin type III domain-containing protein, partial [Bacteroidales bacterium]|nr:fibronectin type III domain-containing protein [Bacteroidales bacterium]